MGPEFATFTQSGLGYLLLRAFSMLQGIELCTSDSSIIKVDCCLKAPAKRPVIMFWEECILGGWCPVRSPSSMSDILFFQVWSWISMNLWTRSPSSEVFGCQPFEWTLTGIGNLYPNENGIIAQYLIPTGDFIARDCHDQIIINVHDRCGTSESVLFESCCDGEPAAVSIGYTLLTMPCSASQTLTAWGGCAPYGWSFSGGGTLVPSEDTLSALYTAPATNVNCTFNPIFTLTDCCGSSGELKLAVNCYTDNDIAIKRREEACSYCLCYGYPGDCYEGKCLVSTGYSTLSSWDWNCANTLLSYTVWNYAGFTLTHEPDCFSNLPDCIYQIDCSYCLTQCAGGCADDASLPGLEPGCGVNDIRTDEMKAAGCCPVNHLTGLPY